MSRLTDRNPKVCLDLVRLDVILRHLTVKHSHDETHDNTKDYIIHSESELRVLTDGAGQAESKETRSRAQDKLERFLLGPITSRVNRLKKGSGESFVFSFDAFHLMPSEEWPSDHAAVATALTML